MTYAVVPAIAGSAAARRPGRLYEPRTHPAAVPIRQLGRPGLLAGMGMTEKQGGSDVRANRTRAVERRTAASG